jgi:hypothetical protein
VFVGVGRVGNFEAVLVFVAFILNVVSVSKKFCASQYCNADEKWRGGRVNKILSSALRANTSARLEPPSVD